MVQVKNLAELKRYLQSNLPGAIIAAQSIENVVAREMSEAVKEVVYDAYTPKQYVRRANNGGLSDTDNIKIISTNIIGDKVVSSVRNTTQGQDSLEGQEIAETIEEGIKANWLNPRGQWSNPRRFNQETARRLNDNPIELINAYKQTLRTIGLKTK